jgi:hypothetical protein
MSVKRVERKRVRIELGWGWGWGWGVGQIDLRTATKNKALDVLDWPSGRMPYSHEAFVKDYASHHVELSGLQRILLTGGSAALSILDPFRGDMIACLGETTGDRALGHCRREMLSTAEGKRILTEKPRINTRSLDLQYLSSLPERSLGKTYWRFLEANVRIRPEYSIARPPSSALALPHPPSKRRLCVDRRCHRTTARPCSSSTTLSWPT